MQQEDARSKVISLHKQSLMMKLHSFIDALHYTTRNGGGKKNNQIN